MPAAKPPAGASNGEDHWHVTDTHTGEPLECLEATGRTLAIDGKDHFVIRVRARRG